MLLKCQINTNTKKRILASYKCLEMILKYSYLVSIILNYQFPKTMFFVLILDFIALAHTLIALSHLNSTEKLHRLIYNDK